MAVGKNKRISKGGKRGNKKKIVEAMSRKEWYDVVAPKVFKTRQFCKTICNKTTGLKNAAENLRGRVFEVNQADLDQSSEKDRPFRNLKMQVMDVEGRNLLTQFHGMSLTTDKIRSQLRKWCTLIESLIEAKTADGYTMRLFVSCFTTRSKGQLSKNCYANSRLGKWIRHRMTMLVKKRLAKMDINQTVVALTNDTLANELHKRCNPILPIRDVKFTKVKVIRTPKFDLQKLTDAHGDVPESKEGVVAEIVEEVAAPAEEKTE